MKLIISTLCFLISIAHILFSQPDANEIIQKVDENFIAKNRIHESEMVIEGKRSKRTIRAKSWIEGNKKAFTEYLAPARERGTKMLKLDDQLWTYSPAADRTIKISGHLLRQSVMGSDLSYEDFMEDANLKEDYSATVLGEDELIQRKCWILELSARHNEVSYFRRKIWVDQKRYLILRDERYGKSGKMLKLYDVKKVDRVQGRWYPTESVFKDVLKSGNGTLIRLKDMKINVKIPKFIFSKAALKK